MTQKYIFHPRFGNLDKWQEQVCDFINKAMSGEISSITTDKIKLTTLTSEPTDKANGMIVYADGTTWNPGSGEGLYCYEGGAWVKM